jgi:DNA-binding Xre family transcriptional regulator
MNNTNNNRADQIFERFNRDYTETAKNVVNYYMDGRYTLALVLNTGRTILWDAFDRTFRPLQNDLDEMSDEQYRKEIGRRISKVMFRKSITQEKLSDMTGIAQQQLSRYISGKTMPNLRVLDKITRALRMSLDELRNIDVNNDIDKY